jgi:hypothetical protein
MWFSSGGFCSCKLSGDFFAFQAADSEEQETEQRLQTDAGSTEEVTLKHLLQANDESERFVRISSFTSGSSHPLAFKQRL